MKARHEMPNAIVCACWNIKDREEVNLKHYAY